jgi:hypothetical protein
MKLWIFLLVAVWVGVAYLTLMPIQKPQAQFTTPTIEARVTALEVEVKRLADQEAKRSGRMR